MKPRARAFKKRDVGKEFGYSTQELGSNPSLVPPLFMNSATLTFWAANKLVCCTGDSYQLFL